MNKVLEAARSVEEATEKAEAYITNTPRAGEASERDEKTFMPKPVPRVTVKDYHPAVEPPGDQPIRHTDAAPETLPVNSPYIHLFRIIRLAYDQASVGKGAERHANGPVGVRDWDKQPSMEIARMVGPGYPAGQGAKKLQEAVTMIGNGNFQGAKAEALGAINYAAKLYKLAEEMEAANQRPLDHVTV